LSNFEVAHILEDEDEDEDDDQTGRKAVLYTALVYTFIFRIGHDTKNALN